MAQWLAIDIGGANLKAADGRGFAKSVPFPLWRNPKLLAQELRTLIAESPPCDHVAATMTGELADCFASKAEGVKFILDALSEATDGRHTRIYLTDGDFVTPATAVRHPRLAAASNWRALAAFAGRFAKSGAALVVDIGSTTCDVVPLQDGQVTARGATDTERLLCGELLYTGVERSPVCALAEKVPYRGSFCPLAHEMFATSLDVYLILGHIAESGDADFTADGRRRNKAEARSRLGRAICADDSEFNHRDAALMAEHLAQAQRDRIADAVEQVIRQMAAEPETAILSGHGEFLARKVLKALSLGVEEVSLARAEGLSSEISRCAAAHALAVLAREATTA